MDCNCCTSMQLVNTSDEFTWQEDIPDYHIYENWECAVCGSAEKIDVTGSYICENE